MKLLILKKFNNYFNRKIIKYDNIEDYAAAASSSLTVTDYNFNPNDGVRTTVVLGLGQVGEDHFFDFEKTNAADYLVCFTTETLHNGDEPDVDVNTIESRWFITEVKRTRGGQYEIQLKRDSIADNFNSLLNCPAYIKKGTVSDDNPLVVNDEGVRVNQIKSGEEPLIDNSKSAWIVGYLSKNFTDKSDPTDPISVQVPDGDYESITLEDLAAELNVSVGALESVLTTQPNNQIYFVNNNIDMVAWLNAVDQSDLEEKFIARSSNLLNSFDTAISSTHHHRLVDCFCTGSVNTVAKATGVAGKPYWLQAWNAYKSAIKANWSSYTGHPLLGRNVYEKLADLAKNKILIYKAGLYYQVKVGGSSVVNTDEKYFTSATEAPFNSLFSQYIAAVNNIQTSPPTGDLTSTNRGVVYINYNELTANIYLTDQITDANVPTVSVDISTSRNGILNQPFDMFAIPYNSIKMENGVNIYQCNGDYAQKLAIALMAKETNGQIYDIQLLPYCPMDIGTGYGIDVTDKTEHYDYDWVDYTGVIEKYNTSTPIAPTVNEYAPQQYEATATYQSTITDTDLIDWGWEAYNEETEPHAQQAFDDWVYGISTRKTVIGGKSKFEIYNQVQDPQSFEYADITVVFWFKWKENGVEHRSIIVYPKNNSFSVNLGYRLELADSMKIDSQTDLYRLVSPNYQGSFDFNVAKNGGRVDGFIADCTYKPYTPYIRVAPRFAWLYGTDYGDARGLICSGDFSIGFYTDKWQEYQLQNKNYQNIFNREIQNLDVNQSIQKTQQRVSGGINILTTAAAGAGAGAMAGGIYGAIAGAGVGSIASGIGYAMDNRLMEQGLTEQRQFAVDKFNMQLENIQALPYTLTKVGAFNINSKVFPFLEYYTCKEQEKEALRMKIKYEGMTIGIVDYLGQYMNHGYLQADLIRNDEIIDDAHLLDDIYIELTKGVYL